MISSRQDVELLVKVADELLGSSVDEPVIRWAENRVRQVAAGSTPGLKKGYIDTGDSRVSSNVLSPGQSCLFGGVQSRQLRDRRGIYLSPIVSKKIEHTDWHAHSLLQSQALWLPRHFVGARREVLGQHRARIRAIAFPELRTMQAIVGNEEERSAGRDTFPL
jgi:hypothetical protein